MRRSAALVVALAPAAAWFATPAHTLVAVIAGALAIAAALHGLGRAVARAVGDAEAPIALVIAWGLGAYLGLAGLALAAGVLDRDGQRALLVAGTAYGAWWWAGRAAVATWPGRPRLDGMTAAAALAIVVALIHTLGAASTWSGAYLDSDGFVLGPLARLAATGRLDDAVGLPRTGGLGGNLVATSLGASFGDWRLCHGIDRGLGLALVFALVLLPSRRRSPAARSPAASRPAASSRAPSSRAPSSPAAAATSTARPYIAIITIALASATPEYALDLAPRWLVVAIVFALLHTWRRATTATPRVGLAAVVLAAGLATLAHGGLGAIVVATAAVAASVPRGPARRRLVRIAVAIATVAVAGYLVAAALAHRDAPAVPSPLATLARGLPVRLVLWALIAGFVYALATVATRARADRALALTLAAVTAAAFAAGVLTPTAGGAWSFVQPLGIALILLLVEVGLDDPERAPGLTPIAMVVVVLLVLTLTTTRFPTGIPPTSWEDRLSAMVQAARAQAQQPARVGGREAAQYQLAQAAIPPGARLGLWVDRPDLVDYHRHTVIDLHSTDADACITIASRQWWRRSPKACRAVGRILPRLGLDYLLIARSALPRDDSWAFRAACLVLQPETCTDPLTPLVRSGRTVATPSDLLVIDLTLSR